MVYIGQWLKKNQHGEIPILGIKDCTKRKGFVKLVTKIRTKKDKLNSTCVSSKNYKNLTFSRKGNENWKPRMKCENWLIK